MPYYSYILCTCNMNFRDHIALYISMYRNRRYTRMTQKKNIFAMSSEIHTNIDQKCLSCFCFVPITKKNRYSHHNFWVWPHRFICKIEFSFKIKMSSVNMYVKKVGNLNSHRFDCNNIQTMFKRVIEKNWIECVNIWAWASYNRPVITKRLRERCLNLNLRLQISAVKTICSDEFRRADYAYACRCKMNFFYFTVYSFTLLYSRL